MTGSIFLGATSYSVSEQEDTVTFSIERTGDLSGPVTVQYATNSDTALAESDFSDTDGSVTIGAGEERATVTIPILNDDLSEETETFNISLITISSGTLLFPRTAIVSILDDENPVEDPEDPPLESDYEVTLENVITGIDKPLNMEWVPGSDSLAFVVEFDGRISIADVTNGEMVSEALDITDQVNSNRDGGLIDIALHPDFENNPYIYAYYVVDPADTEGKTGNAGPDGAGNRFAYVSRFTVDTDGQYPVVDPDSEVVLVGGAGQTLSDISGGGELNYTETIHADARASDVDPVTGEYIQDYIKIDSSSHAGGALAFGPDGNLYIGIGDGTSFNYADPKTVSVQSIDALSGKILRVDPLTGEGLEDNPFVETGDDLTSNSSKVWHLGLRNPYSMTFSEDGKLFISETGWFGYEEINSGEAGANFGWPWYEGGDNGVLEKTSGYKDFTEAQAFYDAVENGQIEVTAAYRAFSHDANDPGYQFQAIVGGSSVYTGDKYPDVFDGDYFFHDIARDTLFSVDTNDRTQLQYLGNIGASNPVVNMVQGPDGYLYAMVLNGSIKRILITEKNPIENQNPYVSSAVAEQDAIIDEPFSFELPDGTFFDPDGDQLTLTATLSDGSALPNWLSFDPVAGSFSGTPDENDAGQLTIKVVAADPDGLFATEIFNLVVAQANDAPVLSAPAFNQSGNVNEEFSYVLPDGMFSDDGSFSLDAKLFDGSDLPSWLEFDQQAGRFSGTPQAGDEGKLIIKVTATDGFGETAYDYFMIDIEADSNQAPVVDNPLEAQVAEEDERFEYAFSSDVFSDPDGDSLTLSASLADDSELPAWLSFNPDLLTFTGTPGNDDVGELVIKVTASDPSGASVYEEFNLKVNGVNNAPELVNPLIDKSVAIDEIRIIPIPMDTFVDVDDDTLVLSIAMDDGSTMPSWIGFGRTPSGEYVVDALAPQGTSGSFDLRITATDAGGLSVSDVFALTIGEGNVAPVLETPILDQVASEGAEFSFVVPDNSFSDAELDPLTYYVRNYDPGDLPDWLSFDPETLTFFGTPGAGDAGTVRVELFAVDPMGETVSDVFEIEVEGSSNADPVVANAISDQTASEDIAFSFALPSDTFSDPDGDELSLSASLSNGDDLPDWLSFDQVNGEFAGTPVEGDDGELEIRVFATDPSGASVYDDFTVDVEAVNDAPVVSLPISDVSGNAGSAFSLTLPEGTFSDIDDDTLTLTATLSDDTPLPDWLSFDAVSRTFSGTATNSDAGEFVVKVTAEDAGGLSASDEFVLTIEAGSTDETLYNDVAGVIQFLDGTSDNDVFVIDGQSSQFGWGPTEDNQGIVVWSDAGPDLLYGFEEIRFNDTSVSLVQDGGIYEDIKSATQYLTGATDNDTFVIDGNSSEYGWGTTLDGEGIVVWSDIGHDILYSFENIEFNDTTIVLDDTPIG